MEKYFYVRQDGTIGNDDDETNGSTVFRVSDMISMGSASNTALALRFKPRMNAFSGGEGANADYKTDLMVQQFNKRGSLTQKYKFTGAFPTALSTIALSWEGNAIETYTCSWTYDCWEHEDLTTQEVITNVQNITGTTTGV